MTWIKPRQKSCVGNGGDAIASRKTVNIIDILHDCELFSAVEPAGFQRLATIARLCHFRKGQVVFRENEPCPGVYVVGQGLVRVFKTGAGGREHVLHMVGPGGAFAEVAAIGDFPLPASAEAVKKTTCVSLPLERFRKALDEDHKLCLGMLTSMTVWVRRLVTLLEDIALRDAAGPHHRLCDPRHRLDGARAGLDGPGRRRRHGTGDPL